MEHIFLQDGTLTHRTYDLAMGQKEHVSMETPCISRSVVSPIGFFGYPVFLTHSHFFKIPGTLKLLHFSDEVGKRLLTIALSLGFGLSVGRNRR